MPWEPRALQPRVREAERRCCTLRKAGAQRPSVLTFRGGAQSEPRNQVCISVPLTPSGFLVLDSQFLKNPKLQRLSL